MQRIQKATHTPNQTSSDNASTPLFSLVRPTLSSLPRSHFRLQTRFSLLPPPKEEPPAWPLRVAHSRNHRALRPEHRRPRPRIPRFLEAENAGHKTPSPRPGPTIARGTPSPEAPLPLCYRDH